MAITKERAQEIRMSCMAHHGWSADVTPEEDAEIRAYWARLPGSTSYFGAVCNMAQGKHLKRR